MKASKGFTLIELLISVAILASVGVVVVGVIAAVLRTSNKTDNIEKIRRDGNYVLSQIAKNIEYAKSFNGISDDPMLTPYTTSCIPPSPTPYFLEVTTWSDDLLEYNCAPPVAPSTDATLTLNGNPIFDANIKLTDCSITCTQSNPTDVPIIEISFTLQQIGANSLVENSAPPIDFRTSVTMRNYSN